MSIEHETNVTSPCPEIPERRLGQPDDIQIIPKGTRLYYKRSHSFVTTEDVPMRGSMSVARIDDVLEQLRLGKRPIV